MAAPSLLLQPHPAEQAPTGLGISVCLSVPDDGAGWLIEFTVTGDVPSLRIPEPVAPCAADGLWRHTCLEAFVQDGEGPCYREFNFSPSGQWAAYRFAAERQRAPDDTPCAPGPVIDCHIRPTQLSLRARVARSLLPAQPGAIGLTAVVETLDGRISHWALHHPLAERPDFHHSAGWTHRPARFPHACLPA